VFTNIGMTCLEELGDLSEAIGDDNGKVKRPQAQKPLKAVKPEQVKSVKPKADPAPVSSESAENAETKPDVQEKAPDSADKKSGSNSKGKKEDAASGAKPVMSEAQKRAVFNLSRRRNISLEDLDKMATAAYGVTVESLSADDARAFIRTLQQAA
jgi:hypothetical protein